MLYKLLALAEDQEQNITDINTKKTNKTKIPNEFFRFNHCLAYSLPVNINFREVLPRSLSVSRGCLYIRVKKLLKQEQMYCIDWMVVVCYWSISCK